MQGGHASLCSPYGSFRSGETFMTSAKSITRSAPSSVQAVTLPSSLLTVQPPARRVPALTGEAAKFVAEAGARVAAWTQFVRQTSASLTIQENADPSVLVDLTTA